jgi:hypothetical protein
MVTEVETAWLAGLIEGEGCIWVQKWTHRGRYAYPGLRLAMTDEDVVRKAHTMSGVGTFRRWHPPSFSQHQPQWVWTVLGVRAFEVCDQVYPHLGERRRAKIDEIRPFVRGMA